MSVLLGSAARKSQQTTPQAGPRYHLDYTRVRARFCAERFLVNDVRKLPIPKVDFADKEQVKKHDALADLAKRMTDATAHARASVTEKDQEFYTRRCARLDADIDALVLKLYGLTENEMPSRVMPSAVPDEGSMTG